MSALWKQYQEQHQDRFLNEMIDLLRIPSISAKSEHKEDMIRCAEAVKNSLLAAGCDRAEVMPTDGYPVVYHRSRCAHRAGLWSLRRTTGRSTRAVA